MDGFGFMIISCLLFARAAPSLWADKKGTIFMTSMMRGFLGDDIPLNSFQVSAHQLTSHHIVHTSSRINSLKQHVISIHPLLKSHDSLKEQVQPSSLAR
jgi:hypothetical protein